MEKEINDLSLNRRDLLKAGLLGLSTGALVLSGCGRKDAAINDRLTIKPKQTGIYEFSAPLPFNFKTIDEMVAMNQGLKKSKVTSLYNGIVAPLSDKFNNWVHLFRGENYSIKTYDDFFKYVKYAQDKGFEFTYLMNSPKPFSKKDFLSFKKELAHLLDLLIKYNVKNIKIANTQVAELINEYAPDKFTLSASTAFEFKNINQYKHLFELYPNFNLIDLTYDENHNFKLLKSLKDNFPKIKIELMVNESCPKGCPMRTSCIAEIAFINNKCSKMCKEMGMLHVFTKTSSIYPWNLEYYSAIGINNFKYVALGTNVDNFRHNYHDITNLKYYLTTVEKGVDDIPAVDFFTKIFEGLNFERYLKSDKLKDMKLGELKQFLPNIKHFISYGHECNYKCGKYCNYCYDCAKKLEEILLYS